MKKARKCLPIRFTRVMIKSFYKLKICHIKTIEKLIIFFLNFPEFYYINLIVFLIYYQ